MKFTVIQEDINNSSGAVCMGYYDVMRGKIPIDTESLSHKIIEYYMAVKYTQNSFGNVGELSPKRKKFVREGFCDPVKMVDIMRSNGNSAMFQIPAEASNRIKGIKRLYETDIFKNKISDDTITIFRNKYGIMIYGVDDPTGSDLLYLFFFYDESGNLCYVNPWDGQSIAMNGIDGHPPETIACSNPRNRYPLILYYLYAGIIID